jgi:RNA polymerase sigma-70 factor, ECF subfamily
LIVLVNMHEDTDKRLDEAVGKVNAGDKNAFATVVDLTIDTLRAYIAFYIRDRSKIDDALQEAYVVMYNSLGKYKEGTSFMAWARTIARFEALSQYRRDQRKNAARVRYTEELTSLMGGAAESEDEAFPLEVKLRALRSCLENLPERARELVDRRYFGGVSVDDLAREQQSKPPAISMALHRARIALAGCVEQAQ